LSCNQNIIKAAVSIIFIIGSKLKVKPQLKRSSDVDDEPAVKKNRPCLNDYRPL